MTPTETSVAPMLDARLNRRQVRVFRWRIDLYRPMPQEVYDDGRATDPEYPERPTTRDVPALKVESKESNQRSIIGRTNYDISLTIDQFEIPATVEIEDGWLLAVTPAGAVAPDRADVQYYIAQGGAQDKPAIGRRKANFRKVFGVKAPRPRFVAESGFRWPIAQIPAGRPTTGNTADSTLTTADSTIGTADQE